MTGIIWLSYGVVAVFIALVFMMIYMTIDTKRFQKKQREMQAYVQQHTSACYGYFIEGDDKQKVVGRTRTELDAIETIAESYIAYINDTAILQRIYHYMDTYYSETYKRQFRGTSRTQRINALYQMLDFHIVSLLPDVKKMLAKKNIARKERFLGLKILATLDEATTYAFYCHAKESLAANQVTMIVNCMSDEMIYDIVDEKHTDTEWLVAALKVMAKRQLAYSSFVVHELLHHENAAVRDEAMNVLNAIGTEKALADFEDYFYSENPENRMLFAKLATHYTLEDVQAYLVVLAQDKSFIVRQAAIQTIGQYPNGRALFENMLASIDDAYMHDAIIAYLKGGSADVAVD